jgi:hypothetical protein
MWFRDNKFWAVVGKIGALVGAIAAIVKIYDYFLPSQAELIGYCTYYVYDIPPDLRGIMVDLHNVRAGKYNAGVQKSITDYKNELTRFEDTLAKLIDTDKASDEKRRLIGELKETNKSILENGTKIFIAEVFNNIIPDKFNESYNPYEGTLYFVVENIGSEVAKDVVISLSFSGIAYVVSQSREVNTVEVKRNIKVGDIRQREFVQIYIWSNEMPRLEHEGLIRLTHSSGIGTILFSVSGFGLSLTILRDYYKLIILGLALLLFGSFIGYSILIEQLTGVHIITRASE